MAWATDYRYSSDAALMPFPSMVTIQAMPSTNIIRYGVLLFWLNGCAITSTSQAPTTDRPATDRTADAETPTDQVAVRRDLENAPKDVRPHANLWRQLTSEFSWHYPIDLPIRRAVALVKQQPRDFERASERASPYLWYVAEQLRRRKLPAELALLPLIESGWRAQAQSQRGAAGLWQFMPATGRRFGLKQTRWYDSRRDVVASPSCA